MSDELVSHEPFYTAMKSIAEYRAASVKFAEGLYKTLRVGCPDRRTLPDEPYGCDFKCKRATDSDQNTKNHLYFCRFCNCPLV